MGVKPSLDQSPYVLSDSSTPGMPRLSPMEIFSRFFGAHTANPSNPSNPQSDKTSLRDFFADLAGDNEERCADSFLKSISEHRGGVTRIVFSRESNNGNLATASEEWYRKVEQFCEDLEELQMLLSLLPEEMEIVSVAMEAAVTFYNLSQPTNQIDVRNFMRILEKVGNNIGATQVILERELAHQAEFDGQEKV